MVMSLIRSIPVVLLSTCFLVTYATTGLEERRDPVGCNKFEDDCAFPTGCHCPWRGGPFDVVGYMYHYSARRNRCYSGGQLGNCNSFISPQECVQTCIAGRGG
uniref:Pancreatic trypsin inhibitor n=1 Tax=Rhipicephalus appendiculatus TaxID=34631 RepID=A0A131YL09_RHIAP